MRGRSGQYGVALITALLVVALATAAAVSMASHGQLDLRRSGNLLQADQIWLYALGVEDWAAQVLRRDREDGEVDHRDEDWATQLPPIPVEGGAVSGFIEELDGRFNLNNVVGGDGKVSTNDLAQLGRLLDALGLEPRLANAVADWIDADIDPMLPDGAEDDAYLRLNPAYRTANRPMTHVSELRLVAGFTPEVYATLRPHVTALPGWTAVNVNTATPAVLRSLVEGITEQEAEQLVADRGDEGYSDTQAFLAHDVLAAREIDARRLSVGSRHFVVTSQIRFDRLKTVQQSLLRRADNGSSETLWRMQGVH